MLQRNAGILRLQVGCYVIIEATPGKPCELVQRRIENPRAMAAIILKGSPTLPGATLEGQNWVAQVNYLNCERRLNPIKVYPEPPLGGEQLDDTYIIHLKLNHVSDKLQGVSRKNIGMIVPSILRQYMACFRAQPGG